MYVNDAYFFLQIFIVMNSDLLPSWLRALGYDAGGKSVHHRGDAVDPTHPYSVELNDLLSPDGQIQAAAVFDVQGSPTVAFFDDEGPVLEDAERFDRIRQRIWNQNLISILMVVSENGLLVYPLGRKHKPALLKPGQASPYSFFPQRIFIREKFSNVFLNGLSRIRGLIGNSFAICKTLCAC